MPKSMTLRLSDEQAAQVEMIARVDKMPVAEVVREGIGMVVDARQADDDFQERLRLHLAEYREQLERLVKDDDA